jgi:hypothetical protein
VEVDFYAKTDLMGICLNLGLFLGPGCEDPYSLNWLVLPNLTLFN